MSMFQLHTFRNGLIFHLLHLQRGTCVALVYHFHLSPDISRCIFFNPNKHGILSVRHLSIEFLYFQTTFRNFKIFAVTVIGDGITDDTLARSKFARNVTVPQNVRFDFFSVISTWNNVQSVSAPQEDSI